ncbi:MAG: ATP-binding protein [Bacteroidota bacterium]
MPLLAPNSAYALDAAPRSAPLQALRDTARLGLRRIARLAARYAQVPCVQIVFLDAQRGIWSLVEGGLDGVKPDARLLYADGHVTDGIEIHNDVHAHDRWVEILPPEVRFFAGFVCYHAEDPTAPNKVTPLAALCLWDTQSRVLHPDQVAFLSELAAGLAEPVGRYESDASRYRTEARLSRIAEATPDAVILAAPDRRIVAVNPAFERLFGYAQDEVAGDTTERLYADPEDYALQGRLRFHPEAADREAAYRVTYRRADGTTFVGETVGVKIAGGADGFLGVIRDVTPQQQAEDALRYARDRAEAAANLIRAFLANINHEIRTPLTGLLGAAEWLRLEAPPSLQQPLELVHQNSLRLKTTLDSVLDLARIEAGEMPTQLERFAPVPLLQTVLDEAHSLAEERALSLHLKASLPESVAEGHASIFGRIASHLVTNALKFTEEGHVEVALEPLDDGLRLRVTDTGCGIDPEFLPYVFNAFEQESDGWTRTHDGVGIGLTIAQRLTALIDGTIEARSTLGVGSTFTVTLPCTWLPGADSAASVSTQADATTQRRDAQPEADQPEAFRFADDVSASDVLASDASASQEHTSASAVEGVPVNGVPVDAKPFAPSGLRQSQQREPAHREPPMAAVQTPETAAPGPLAQPTGLLVVDADQTICSLVGAYLMGICEVHAATTLAEALERAEERPFDLLLLSPNLTDTASGEVLAQLRACAGTAGAYAIALTEPGQGAPPGFDAALHKPLDDMELVLTVGAALAG